MQGYKTAEKGLARAAFVFILGLALVVIGTVGLAGEAHAANLTAGSLKAQSVSTLKCYTIGTANTPVYSNANLTSRIGAVYGSDEVQINSFSANKAAVNVTYPTSRGSKSG